MLPSAELAQLRTETERSFPDTCHILRRVMVDDGQGGQYEGEPQLIGPIRCRFSPSGLTPTERLIAERVAPDHVWIATLPAGTEVRGSDQIKYEGRVYEVVAAQAPRSWELARRVLVKVSP